MENEKQLNGREQVKTGAYCCDEEEELLELHDREEEE